MPVFNADRYIEDTICSVLNQTYLNYEFLIINDCSTDRSEEIILKYKNEDSRIKYFRLEENYGAAVARNYGLERATGQYIAFIDSDDVWFPEKLDLQINFMQQNNYCFTYTLYRVINESGNVLKIPTKLPERLDYKGVLKNTAIACFTVVIDKKIVGDFRMPLVRRGQDLATWLNILKYVDYAHLLPEVLGNYRSHASSLSNNKFKALKRTWHVYYHLEKLPFHQSLYYFIHYAINAISRRF